MTSSSFRQFPEPRIRTQEAIQADLDAMRSTDEDIAQNEEEKKKRDAESKKRQAQQQAQQAENKKKLKEQGGLAGAVKEVGKAVVGAGIDAVEGVAGNVQQGVTGQLGNPDFKPTWLQVPDDQEPINKTWWGQMIRGIGEYALLGMGLRFAGGTVAGRAGAVGAAGRALSSNSFRAEAARGALIGNLSSQSQGENVSRMAMDASEGWRKGLKEQGLGPLVEAFEWLPEVLATNDADHPLLKRAKNTLEGLGFDKLFDSITGALRGSRAARQAAEAQLAEAQARIQTKIEQDAARQTRIQEAKQAYEGLRDQYNVAQAAALGKPKDDPAVAEAKRLRDQMREAGVRYRAEKSATNLETATPASPEPVRDNSDISARVSAAEIEAQVTGTPQAAAAPTRSSEPAGTASAPQSTTGLGELGKNLGGGIGASLRNQLWESWQKGSTKVAGIKDPVLVAAQRANVSRTDRAAFDQFLELLESYAASKRSSEPAGTASAPQSTTGLGELGKNLGGGIGASLRNQLWESWQKGSTKVAGIKDPVLVAAQRANVSRTDRAAFDQFLESYGAPVRDNEDIAARVSAAEIESNQKARQANFDELANSRLADDPEGLKGPDPYVNSPLYDPNERPIFSVKKDGLEKALLDAFKINTDPRYFRGRPESLVTEAALEKRLAGDFKERRRVIENLAKQITKMPDFIGEYEGIKVTKKEYQQLAIARLLDTIDEFSDPEDMEGLKAKLMSNPASNDRNGRTVTYMNDANVAAAELLINVTAGEMADLATAARSVRGVMDTTTQEEMILKRMEFLLKETYFAKYMAGSSLVSKKWGGLQLINPQKSDIDEVARRIDDEVATRISTIRELRDKGDDRLMKLYMDAISISDGSVRTLVDLDRYMKDRIHKLTGNPSEQGGFIRGMVSTMTNSMLSGHKTILRAWTGTSTAVALRPITTMIGGIKRGDSKVTAKALHQMAVYWEGFGEALTMARKSWDSHLAGDGNIYDNFAGNTDALHNTEEWRALGDWVEQRGDIGNKVGYTLGTWISRFNNSPFVSYPMGLMGVGDAANRTILGRMELKAMAFDKAWDENKGVVDALLVRKYEDELHSLVFNKDGVVTDLAAKMAGDESTLTSDLGPMFQRADDLIKSFPVLASFFMFAKTSVNALKYTMTYNPLGTKVPILNKFLHEVNEVMNVTPDTMEAVMVKYGIKDIAAAQAMYDGRVAFGQGIALGAVGLYLSGNLRGNGPADKELRKSWEADGWRARQIRVNGQWFSFDNLDPFAPLLALVADIGDNAENMSPTDVEGWYSRISYVVAMNLTNKSFLAGIQPLAEILAAGNSGYQFQRMIGQTANNIFPYSSVRKEIAESFHPGMRELEENWWDFIRNRNPVLRDQLPLKYDYMNGKPIRLYDPMTRFYNFLSPIQTNPDISETRELLRLSGFDAAPTLKTDSRGRKLTAKERSRLANEMGKENIESQLAELFKTQTYLESWQFARELRDRGIQQKEWPARAHFHTDQLKLIYNRAKGNAETRIRLETGETEAIVRSRTLGAAKEAAKSGNTDRARELLNLINISK